MLIICVLSEPHPLGRVGDYRLTEFRFRLLMGVYTNLFSHFTWGMGGLTLRSRDSAGELTRMQFLLQVLGLSPLVGTHQQSWSTMTGSLATHLTWSWGLTGPNSLGPYIPFERGSYLS